MLFQWIEIVGQRPPRDEQAIEAFFNALEQQLLAAQLLELERSMRVAPDTVANAEPQAQCSKTGATTRSSSTDRYLSANEAARAYVSARRSAGESFSALSGRNIRVVYADGSSEVWTISSPANPGFVVAGEPVAGSQLPANESTAAAYRAAG
jgi:hypothetical protein